MTDTIVDQALVSELKDVMGEGFSALVDSFRADAEKRLGALEQHLADADPEALRQQAHSFKGSSGNVGAVQVADLCLSLEKQADGGDLQQAPATIRELRDAVQRYLSQVG
ncbi:MAG: Hpt domain-containing protein [Alcanivoracaceae bacterium]|jgi:hypothetical protein